MSTDQVINPELIEQTKQQIRSLVNEIAQLARQDIGAAEFYSEFLNRVVTALAAVGGAVWTVAEGGGLQLEYQVNLRETHLGENEEDTARHGRLLHKVLRSGEGRTGGPLLRRRRRNRRQDRQSHAAVTRAWPGAASRTNRRGSWRSSSGPIPTCARNGDI